MAYEWVGPPRLLIAPVQFETPLVGSDSDCCCPLARGRCSPPYDLQPASLGGSPVPLSVPQQAIVLLAGSVLELLLADLPLLATRHAERLAGLLGVI